MTFSKERLRMIAVMIQSIRASSKNGNGRSEGMGAVDGVRDPVV